MRQYFQDTLDNWQMHNLLNCIEIDAKSCPQLFDIFQNAKNLLANVYKAELKGDPALNLDFMQATLWLKRDANASACSMALPGQRALPSSLPPSLPPSFPPSLPASLSLSLSHTHTQVQSLPVDGLMGVVAGVIAGTKY